ncbi:U3 snoRNP protein [Mactra antiquata]
MLRRTTKRKTVDTSKGDRTQYKTSLSVENDLTGQKKKYKIEKRTDVLETLVLGDESDLIENLHDLEKQTDDKRKSRQSGNKIHTKPLKKQPVWRDEDDKQGSILLTKARKFNDVRHENETKIPKGEYSRRLKTQFEKISAAPNWSKLPSERIHNSDDDDEDSDVEELVQKTSTYIKQSTTLPKSILQIKSCTDLNKQYPFKGKLTALEFHPTSQVALTASLSQTLSLFQVDGKINSKIQSVFVDKFPIHCAHFTCDGEQIVMSSRYKSIKYFDMIQGSIINVPIKGVSDNSLNNFVVSPDGKYLVFLAQYGAMHFLSSKTKEWLFTLSMNGNVKSVAFTNDGLQMYSFGDEGDVYIWDIKTRDCIHKFYDDGCTHGTSISISPNNQYLACGSDTGVVNLYDRSLCLTTSEPKPLKAIMNLTTNCSETKFNSTSEILCVTSDCAEKAVKMVHVASQTVYSNFPDNLETNLTMPSCIDFSLNSGYFTVGTNKGKALLYRLKHYGDY